MEGFELQMGLAKGSTVKVVKARHIWEAVVIEQGSLRVNTTSPHSALALQTQYLFSPLVQCTCTGYSKGQHLTSLHRDTC